MGKPQSLLEKEQKTSNAERNVSEFRIDEKLIAWELNGENPRGNERYKKEGHIYPNRKYRMFKKKIYKFESLYKFI
jgi:hypothetical protein